MSSVLSFPSDYAERVYAGVLGKIIGVYLGRPFEQWDHERIERELGEIWYYVNDKLKHSLVVTDDDITGTFTFVRALEDHGGTRELTAEQIGKSWLNYIIENKTILWWGGLGNSTEHTAYIRLKRGIPAPASGSIATNGKGVAEQIGAQIFIDGWAMVAPNDPALAVELAGKAATVSHDGEAKYAAQLIAAMESAAFGESNLDKLLDLGLSFIPQDSIIATMTRDLRDLRKREPDWRKAYAYLKERHGYHLYPGGCHVVPNHGLVQLALLWGDDDFQKSLMIVNTCGWDTDCNSANVGCFLGIKNGLAGIDGGADFRGPVADRMLLPTADGGRAISDAVCETYALVKMASKLSGHPFVAPKNGARFHFSLPGSVQGFQIEHSIHTPSQSSVSNVVLPAYAGDGRGLAIHAKQLATGRPTRVFTPTFAQPDQLAGGGYELLASPTLYPGQTVEARVAADSANVQPLPVRLVIRHYNAHDQLLIIGGESDSIAPGAAKTLRFTVPDLGGLPVASVGLEISGERGADGAIYLDRVGWTGEPRFTITRITTGPAVAAMKAWVDQAYLWHRESHRLHVTSNNGLAIASYGTRESRDIRVTAELHPQMAAATGIAVRVQGLRRFYTAWLKPKGENGCVCELVRVYDDVTTVLASTDLSGEFGLIRTLSLAAQGNVLSCRVDGHDALQATDSLLSDGALAAVVDDGRLYVHSIAVEPA